MAKDAPKDVRRGLRFSILIRQIRVESGSEVFFGYASNISIGGMYVQTINPKPPGFEVTVRFNLPKDDAPLECLSAVVWSQEYDSVKCRKPGMGLRFLNITEADRERITAFLEKQVYDRNLDIVQT
ncbi:MAG: TIGR02266 family protein [Acidobacteriota bacterium]